MKSIKYMILLSFFTQFITSHAFADCKSTKQDAKQKVQQISTQMRGANACNSNKLTVQALEINIEFLDACPEADPDGYKKEEILLSIKNAQKAKKATCS